MLFSYPSFDNGQPEIFNLQQRHLVYKNVLGWIAVPITGRIGECFTWTLRSTFSFFKNWFGNIWGFEVGAAEVGGWQEGRIAPVVVHDWKKKSFNKNF